MRPLALSRTNPGAEPHEQVALKASNTQQVTSIFGLGDPILHFRYPHGSEGDKPWNAGK
jgi:hypothetical protein